MAYFRHTRLIIKDRPSGSGASSVVGASSLDGSRALPSTPVRATAGSLSQEHGSIPESGERAGVGATNETHSSASTPNVLRVDVTAAGAWAGGETAKKSDSSQRPARASRLGKRSQK